MIEGVAAGAKGVVLQVIVVAITYFARVISVARSGVKVVVWVTVWLFVSTSGLSKHFPSVEVCFWPAGVVFGRQRAEPCCPPFLLPDSTVERHISLVNTFGSSDVQQRVQ